MVVQIDIVRAVRALSGLIVATEWLPGTALRTCFTEVESQTRAKEVKATDAAKI